MNYRSLIAVLCLILAHCAQQPPSIPNRAVFDQAVRDYLQSRSMDLAIATYRDFEMGANEHKAVAIIAMKYGGEGYAKARVRFRFYFEQTGNEWHVARHEQLK